MAEWTLRIGPADDLRLERSRPDGNGNGEPGRDPASLRVEVFGADIRVCLSVESRTTRPHLTTIAAESCTPSQAVAENEVPGIVEPEEVCPACADHPDGPAPQDPEVPRPPKPCPRAHGSHGQSTKILTILDACRSPRTRRDLQKLTGFKQRQYFGRAYLVPLIRSGLLDRTVPDAARSNRQRYRTTEAGLAFLGQGRDTGASPARNSQDDRPAPSSFPEARLGKIRRGSRNVIAVLAVCRSPRSRNEIHAAMGLKDQKHLRMAYLRPLLKAGLLAMTVPDNPRSRFQRYRTTEQGLALLAKGSDA